MESKSDLLDRTSCLMEQRSAFSNFLDSTKISHQKVEIFWCYLSMLPKYLPVLARYFGSIQEMRADSMQKHTELAVSMVSPRIKRFSAQNTYCYIYAGKNNRFATSTSIKS